MTTAQQIALACAFERLQARIAAQPVTKCARNYHGVPTHKCTGGKFCKGDCKPHTVNRTSRRGYSRRTANIAE